MEMNKDTEGEHALAAEVLRVAVEDLRDGRGEARDQALCFFRDNTEARGSCRWWCRMAGVSPEAFLDRIHMERYRTEERPRRRFKGTGHAGWAWAGWGRRRRDR